VKRKNRKYFKITNGEDKKEKERSKSSIERMKKRTLKLSK
jgi:hypothetical protein